MENSWFIIGARYLVEHISVEFPPKNFRWNTYVSELTFLLFPNVIECKNNGGTNKISPSSTSYSTKSILYIHFPLVINVSSASSCQWLVTPMYSEERFVIYFCTGKKLSPCLASSFWSIASVCTFFKFITSYHYFIYFIFNSSIVLYIVKILQDNFIFYFYNSSIIHIFQCIYIIWVKEFTKHQF